MIRALRLVAGLLAPVLLAVACVPEPAPAPEQPPVDQCNAARFEVLVGQSATVVKDMTFPANTRIIQPNSAVTMDYRPDRLNVEIGDNQRIAKVSCY